MECCPCTEIEDYKKALYPIIRMKMLKPIYELVKGRIPFPFVPAIQTTTHGPNLLVVNAKSSCSLTQTRQHKV